MPQMLLRKLRRRILDQQQSRGILAIAILGYDGLRLGRETCLLRERREFISLQRSQAALESRRPKRILLRSIQKPFRQAQADRRERRRIGMRAHGIHKRRQVPVEMACTGRTSRMKLPSSTS